MSKTVTRLYTQFQPASYAIRWELDEPAMRFRGHVVIEGKKVGRPSQRLTFHANGLKVTSAKLTAHTKKGDSELTIARINLQKTYHEVRLHTEETVYPGPYTIEMNFETPITNGMTGIYPCYFKDGDIEKKLFATQFESHHAREAFPCIDEPEAKAVFTTTLVTQPGIVTLGNTPIAEQTEVDGTLVTTFEPSPKMSSYLLAFVVGDLHSKSAKTASGVDVNIWGTSAQPAEALEAALEFATGSIEYFEDYFGVPYPLPKADHVALPDFSSGAMENWGLITYRERVLLAYPGETSQSTLEHIALVIAHETSHQWFGNLVTMQWWDDLWLNESFANMMEYQTIDAMRPKWHVWHQFISAEGLSAFRRDAVAGVQSVHVDVNHPDEISTLFDPSIVYAKGGRLLYMLKNYIGEDAFRTGLSAYFQKHQYGNTTGGDLWAALSEASGKDIAAFMTPWLAQSGFPVVRVDQDATRVSLTQQHFLDDPSKADDRTWPVPLFANDDNQELLTTKEKSFETNEAAYLINTDARGHYLVDYTNEATKQVITEKISDQTFDEPDRLMLLNSSSMLAKAGMQSFGDTLELLEAYQTESSEPVWDMIGLIIGEARRFMNLDESIEPKIKQYIRTLIESQHERLGWEGPTDESAADQKLRSLIIGLGAYAEHEEIVAEATARFETYMTAGTPLPAELRSTIMSVPVRASDSAAVDFLISLHDSTGNSDLQSDICDALTATKDSETASRLLARLTDSKLVKPQDVDRWLIYLMRNRYTRDVAWQWMVNKWDWLEKTFSNDKSYDYLPRYAASAVANREYEQKFHDLFDSKVDQPLLKRNILLGGEEIATRLAWLERDLPAVQTFFK